MDQKRERIKDLVTQLNAASKAYYQEDVELMSNREYDALYDELVALEQKAGIVLSSSPTVNVGYEVVSSLPKERHPSPMLSLDKTKDVEALQEWLGDQPGLLSWKLDGLTIVLTYENGQLSRAVTRGDGVIGEVITGNAKVFDNVPLTIPAKEQVVVRGEAVISYPQFERINETIEDGEAKYKNPRNLCSGTVRQLNSEITAQRHVQFFAFSLAAGGTVGEEIGSVEGVQIDMFGTNGIDANRAIANASGSKAADTGDESADAGNIGIETGSEAADAGSEVADTGDESADAGNIGIETGSEAVDASAKRGSGMTTRHAQMAWLRAQGFETVEEVPVTRETLPDAVAEFARKIETFEIPSDGLVLIYDDIAYGRSLGTTAKFPRDSIAFKWQDEMAETRLREVLWNPSRTGLINPIAVFDPVELEGTTVSRASVHNLSIVEQLQLAISDRILVYKANMIIPQIEKNLDAAGDRNERLVRPPQVCPACGEHTEIHDENGIRTLHCPNPDCPAKKIKSFTHFVSRAAMNIEGLSESTLEKLIGQGCIHELADIFRLKEHRETIIGMEGLGEKSFDNLLAACEKASHTTPDRLLNSLGIPGIGTANARMICLAGKNKWETIQHMTEEQMLAIDGIGDVLARDYTAFFRDEKNARIVADLLPLLHLDESFEEAGDQPLQGKIFVITGSLEQFENRDAAKARIQALGGKVAGSVSKKTDFLVNNDIGSGSSKNKKAKELGIPIITEAELLEMTRS